MSLRLRVPCVAAALALVAPACTLLKDGAGEPIQDASDADAGDTDAAGCPQLGAFRCSGNGTAELCARVDGRLAWATASDCGDGGCSCPEAGVLLDEAFVSCRVEEATGPCGTGPCGGTWTVARTGVLTCPSGAAVEISPEDIRSFADFAVSDGMLSALAYGTGCTAAGTWADGWIVVTLRTDRRVLARDLLTCDDVRDPVTLQVGALDTKYCRPSP